MTIRIELLIKATDYYYIFFFIIKKNQMRYDLFNKIVQYINIYLNKNGLLIFTWIG